MFQQPEATRAWVGVQLAAELARIREGEHMRIPLAHTFQIAYMTIPRRVTDLPEMYRALNSDASDLYACTWKAPARRASRRFGLRAVYVPREAGGRCVCIFRS